MQYMVFIYKTAKFAPVWSDILKILAIFVHQTLTEHALLEYSQRRICFVYDQRGDASGKLGAAFEI